ncbi:GATA zinc finger domain-containing protein 4-like [Agrilus planipennis]|uniref:GATA zinc finger domain-containing protein 4-like n=1 Tax=Agrilus planipennis TaxID=224129 RepID=A0A7F5RDI2_AGRPL|nr:GATA zinc finger domain-containing protein 4-like [Agrilus planipennis]
MSVEILDLEDLNQSINSIRISDVFNTNETIMPNQNTESLISAARNYGEILPKFEGKSSNLETFILRVDSFYQKYGNTADVTLNEYVYCLICNKLTGEASDFVTCRPDINTWILLKEALRHKFGDFTDRKILSHQFKMLKIKQDENLVEFIERIRSVQTRLDIKTQSDSALTREQKQIHKEINEQTALEVLYNNSPAMLQTIMDVREHATLSAATNTVLNFITKHPPEKQKTNISPKVHINQPINNQFQNQNFTRTSQNNSFVNRGNVAQNTSRNNFTNQPRMQSFQQRNYNPNTQNNYTSRSTSQNQNNFRQLNQNTSRVNNAPITRNTQNLPPDNSLRSSTFQRTAFKNWRQPRINCTEVEPVDYENQNYCEDENYYENQNYCEETNPEYFPEDYYNCNNTEEINSVGCNNEQLNQDHVDVVNFQPPASDNN